MSKTHPAWDKKRKMGDRFDGTLLRKLHPMHVITPVLYPNRCDNEAFFAESIDVTRLREYARQKNKNKAEGDLDYSAFQLIVMSIIKLFYMRPKLNRFVANKLMYQRNEITASFIVKKKFNDEAQEALAIVNAMEDDNMESLHQKISAQIMSGRSDELDKSSESMDIVSRMPRKLTRAFCEFICFLDKIGRCPKGLIDTDPYYTSVVIANLGSIGLKAGYHHLTNWGTTSIFVVVGDIHKKEIVNEDGTTSVREMMDFGLTVDERIADGFYYSKSLRLLKKIIANPEILEQPLNTPYE